MVFDIPMILLFYYRNQLFTEEEKEALFLDKIEKGIIYVMGQKVWGIGTDKLITNKWNNKNIYQD